MSISRSSSPATAVQFATWPYFAPDEIEAATAVLRSGKVNYWTGAEGRQFEREFANFAGCRHAVALANGTVALEAALRALGIGPGDEVITTSRTFVASASCAVAVGARPVIADVDARSARTLRVTRSRKSSLSPHEGHYRSAPCWVAMRHGLDLRLAWTHGLRAIEDCAQAHGATYKGRPVGSMGDIAAFSFCQDKIMTTAGEGGMVTTNSEDLWNAVWAYKDHGKSYAAVYSREHPPGYRWLHESFGTNWRMTEVQSAIGRVILPKLPSWLNTRRQFARLLTQRFANVPGLRVTVPPSDVEHSYYKYYAFVRPEVLRPTWNRNRIVNAINDAGVPCFTGSCSEIYLERAFSADLRPPQRLPVAKQLGETSLMFLVHPTLTEEAICATADVVEQLMNAAVQP